MLNLVTRGGVGGGGNYLKDQWVWTTHKPLPPSLKGPHQ